MGTSAEAKERLFRKDRQFTPEQRAWLDRWKGLATRAPRDRLTVDTFREVLIHLKVGRNELMVHGRNVLHKTTTELTQEETVPELVSLMVDAKVFPGDDELVRRIRELAQRFGATRRQLIKAR